MPVYFPLPGWSSWLLRQLECQRIELAALHRTDPCHEHQARLGRDAADSCQVRQRISYRNNGHCRVSLSLVDMRLVYCNVPPLIHVANIESGDPFVEFDACPPG